MVKLDLRVFTGETMDTERFQKNIEQADSNSLRIGAANRVLQLLQKLRYPIPEIEAHVIWRSITMEQCFG